MLAREAPPGMKRGFRNVRSERLVETLGVELRRAVRTQAGTDPRIGEALDIDLHPAPVTLRAEDSLARHTNRQQSVEPLNFGQSCLELLDEALALLCRFLAFIQQPFLAKHPAHGQRQPAEAILDDVIVRTLV